MFTSLAAATLVFTGLFAQTAPAFEDMPKIDVHAHYFDDMPEFVKMLDRINMRVVVICVFKNRPGIVPAMEERAVMLANKYPAQIHFASTFDLTEINSPEFAADTNRWLDRTYAEGAIMTKIWKEVGMATQTADGKFLMPDSRILDPIYAHIAEQGKPLMAHFGDPIEAWQPLTPENIHLKYFTQNPEWHMHGRADHPTHVQIMEAVDHMLEKHPDLVVIGAHLGSLEHDLDALGRRLDRFPNYNIDVAARTPDLRRHPVEKVRAFFIKYQDRILYGLDQGVYTPGGLTVDDQISYAKQLEDWYRHEYAFYAGPELALQREVLEKFFHGNAERLLPALKK